MKKINIIFDGRVEDGIIKLKDEPFYFRYLNSLNGKDIELIIRERNLVRTSPQNAYYWAVVVELIAEELGYDKEEAHEALKFKFLRKHSGKLPSVRSTTDLDTKEFEDYVEKIRRFAAEELNINIPDPNQVEINA